VPAPQVEDTTGGPGGSHKWKVGTGLLGRATQLRRGGEVLQGRDASRTLRRVWLYGRSNREIEFQRNIKGETDTVPNSAPDD